MNARNFRKAIEGLRKAKAQLSSLVPKLELEVIRITNTQNLSDVVKRMGEV